jgi:hypothetical protein
MELCELHSLVHRKRNQASAYSKHSGYSTGQAFLAKDAVEALSFPSCVSILGMAQETATQLVS